MKGIQVWPGRLSGPDPTIHFWFEDTERVPQRVCDGSVWVDTPNSEQDVPPLYVPCLVCQEIYVDDGLRGRQLLRIAVTRPHLANGEGTPENGEGTPENEAAKMAIQAELDPTMPIIPPISVLRFAQFTASTMKERQKLVEDIRHRMVSSNKYPPYYQGFRDWLRGTHWATGSIETFENGLPYFLRDLKGNSTRVARYKELGERYIDFWKGRDAAYVSVEGCDVRVEPLTIRVRPELGMRVGDDIQVLKLWMNSDPPKRLARHVVSYFMSTAAKQTETWLDDYAFGIWDISRSNILQPIQLPDNLSYSIAAAIATFKTIWTDIGRALPRTEW